MIGEPPRQDRSEEEREAARQARERARAEREAKRAGRKPKAAPGRKAAAEPKPARGPRPSLSLRMPKVLREREPQRPTREPEPRPAAATPAARHPDARDPDPSGAPTRASVRERADALLSSRRAGSPPGAGPAGAGRFRRRRLVVLVAFAAVLLFGLWLLVSLFQPGRGDGEGTVAVTIPRGSGVGDIGDLLADRGVVDSGFFFELRATVGGSRGDLKPGIYNLRRDMSYAAAIDALSEGPPRNLVNVTITEGTARREVAGRIEEAGLRGSYVKATARSRALNPRRYGARRARDLEGFLFPATYQLRRGSPVSALVDKQLAAFKENWAKVDLRAARRANLTPYDVLIIASLVEREAQLDKERPLVASVVYNRLRAGMNLGIDATVRYAVNNWTGPLKQSELQSDSPYNTRNRPGLPPGPIGNPGLASMRAAARPARTKYLFYVVKPGTCGEHSFAATDAEHQRNVARYERAREAAGGQSPDSC